MIDDDNNYDDDGIIHHLQVSYIYIFMMEPFHNAYMNALGSADFSLILLLYIYRSYSL